MAGNSFTFYDTSVTPEKTYRYTVKAKSGGLGYKQYADFPIKVPSDATLALEAAQRAESSAIEARDAANAAHEDAEKAANNTYYSGKSSAQWGYDTYNKISAVENNLNIKINNIENLLSGGDTIPPDIKSISGYNGATATTGSSFNVIVQASDNSNSNIEFRVKADTGTWSNWTSINNYATATEISGIGAHTINVEVRDISGNITSGKMIAFKI